MTGAQATSDSAARFQQHEHREGETFDYLYESTEAVFSTEQVRGARIPRVTDLLKIDECRTRIRFSILAEGATLRKQVEFSDMRFREITAEQLERRETVPFATGQELLGLPEVVTHTYDVGADGRIGADLSVVFGAHLAGTGRREPYKFIDAFTFAATVETLSASMTVGDVRTRPAVDVELNGARFHNHVQYLFFDRVDVIDGVPHAFVKVQSPGNFMDRSQHETIWVLTAHVPLVGPASGLVSRGELQEVVYAAGDGPVTATQRQLSMTMQTEQRLSPQDPRSKASSAT